MNGVSSFFMCSKVSAFQREHTFMCDEAILACLKSIEDTLNSDVYEYSDPFTIGGATGAYFMKSPWNTECEWSIVSALATGTIASTATFVIGSKNPTQPALSSTGGDTFGKVATSGTDSNNALSSYVGALTAQAPFVTFGGDNYMPLANPPFVYLQTTTPASSEILVTIQFRRKLNRYIPAKPRTKPHTHSHPQSRRETRTMMEGYAAQYPQEGQPYQHQELPPQDTGVARRGVFPLGPTNVTHRKVGHNANKR